MVKLHLLLSILLFTATVHAQSITPKQAEVHHTIKNLFAALTNADTTAMRNLGTKTIRFYEYGEVWTMHTLIHKVLQSKSIPDFKRTNNFEFVNTTIAKKIAWVTYYLQSSITRNGKEDIIKWMETVVLIKDRKKWKVDVLHSTRLPKN